jgi:hypothetical protein
MLPGRLTILRLIERTIILAGTLSQDIQMSDEHSGGVKKRKRVDNYHVFLSCPFEIKVGCLD